MATYSQELTLVRQRVHSSWDVVRGPATSAQISALRGAVRTQLGMALPEAYAQFLAECNGFRVNDGRILGVDADLTGDASPSAPQGVDACLALNLDREAARQAVGRRERYLFLAWYGEVGWVMKEDGSFWEIDAETLDEVEPFRDGVAMLRWVARRIGTDV